MSRLPSAGLSAALSDTQLPESHFLGTGLKARRNPPSWPGASEILSEKQNQTKMDVSVLCVLTCLAHSTNGKTAAREQSSTSFLEVAFYRKVTSQRVSSAALTWNPRGRPRAPSDGRAQRDNERDLSLCHRRRNLAWPCRENAPR